MFSEVHFTCVTFQHPAIYRSPHNWLLLQRKIHYYCFTISGNRLIEYGNI